MDFKEFMLPNIKEAKEEIITFKGVETFKDSKGKPIPLDFRKMNRKEYRELIKQFKIRKPAIDDKGDYIISSNNKLVYDEELDTAGLNDAVIAKTMVVPNLYDKELMEYYGVYSATELLNVMFKGDDYDYVDRLSLIHI